MREPVRLAPAERAVLRTCKTTRDMRAVIRSVRTELNGGSKKKLRHGPGNMLRHVLLVGLVRQPLFFIFGPFIAIVCYLALIYKSFS